MVDRHEEENYRSIRLSVEDRLEVFRIASAVLAVLVLVAAGVVAVVCR